MRVSLMSRINWELFDPAKVDARLLRLAKGASLVEYNSNDYVTYLRNVFADDPAICQSLDQWGAEEREHGEALARWAKMCDPNFDFERSLKKFKSLYSINTDVSHSIRGSRTLELIARCLVETGTSTYYTALADSSAEPLFAQICRQIAAEEVRHYTLFHKLLPKYQAQEKVGVLARLKVAVSRSIEAQDAELTTAYSCANRNGREILSHELASDAQEFIALGYHLYQKKHLKMVVKLGANAVGLSSADWLSQPVSSLLAGVFKYQRWNRRNIVLPARHTSPPRSLAGSR